jgi:cytochrome c553
MHTMKQLHPQWILILALFLSLGALGFAQGDDAATSQPDLGQLKSQFRETVQPFLETNCYRCHGEKKQKSGVRIDILDGCLEDKQLFLLKHVLTQLKHCRRASEKCAPSMARCGG